MADRIAIAESRSLNELSVTTRRNASSRRIATSGPRNAWHSTCVSAMEKRVTFATSMTNGARNGLTRTAVNIIPAMRFCASSIARGIEILAAGKLPVRVRGTATNSRLVLTELSEDFADTVAVSELIAGYDHDPSLGRNGVEPISLTPALQQLVEGIPEYGENAGKPMREPLVLGVARPSAVCSTCATWTTTIGARSSMASIPASDELRTFDINKLVPAVKWVRAMWRFFEKPR